MSMFWSVPYRDASPFTNSSADIPRLCSFPTSVRNQSYDGDYMAPRNIFDMTDTNFHIQLDEGGQYQRETGWGTRHKREEC
jgi:hypothetical protein